MLMVKLEQVKPTKSRTFTVLLKKENTKCTKKYF